MFVSFRFANVAGITMCLLAAIVGLSMLGSIDAMGQESAERKTLPAPRLQGDISVEEALQARRSRREFAREALDLADISQILWSAQGLTHEAGYRTAPSAGALYPMELYLLAGEVEGLATGVYHYRPAQHDLVLHGDGDCRNALVEAALGQDWVGQAPAVIVLGADYRRSARKYGSRARRYVHVETGHVAQNIYLQATVLGLGTVLVGAFDDAAVQRVLKLPGELTPLGLMPVGKPRE